MNNMKGRSRINGQMTVNPKSILYQLKVLFPILAAVYIPSLLILCVLTIIVLQTNIPMAYFTQDPVLLMEAPNYIGLLSNIGVLLWCSTAAVCIFSFVVLRRNINGRELSWFLLYSGLITTIMLLDDFFVLHGGHGLVIELLIIAGYAIMVLLYIVRFKTIILDTEFLVFLLALAFFALSNVTDIVTVVASLKISSDLEYLVEDGSKLLGIASWFVYFSRVCLKQMLAVTG